MKKDKHVTKNIEDKNDSNIEYKSSNILLNMAMDEYAKERERANTLDNKASFFITAILAIATIFIPIIPFSELLAFFQNKNATIQKCISSVFLTGIFVAFIVLFIAYKKLYDAYKLTNYMRANLECINFQDNHIKTNDKLSRELCDHYKTIVNHNIEVNDKKCDSIGIGIMLCGIGFVILLTTVIGLIIIIGG